MNRIILILTTIFLLNSCENKTKNTQQENSVELEKLVKNDTVYVFDTVFITDIKKQVSLNKESEQFIPDTTVNSRIILENDNSVLKNFGDISHLVRPDTGKIMIRFPVVYYKNKSGTQFLRMELHPGNCSNQFSKFTIGYIKYIPEKEPLNQSNFINFYTESGIKLGMSLEEVQKIKGYFYNSADLENTRVLIYKIEEHVCINGDYIFTSKFLERYGLPVYTAYYWFKNDKLVKFEYGFEYL